MRGQPQRWAFFLLATFVVGAASFRDPEAIATAAAPDGSPKNGSVELSGEPGEEGQFLLREGSKLESILGEFQSLGGRLQFNRQNAQVSLTVLENLASQRVARAIAETRNSAAWQVSGVVTEYRDSNFLLLTRAVARSSVDGDKDD